MSKHFLVTVTALMSSVVCASAQNMQRRAVVTGGGNNSQGRCVVEVVVDGAATVEIRGNNATLRDLSGQAPQWRRFECTSAMPANAANVRFNGVSGRGSQELISDPRGGGPLMVRIEDPESGADTYAFQISWDNGGGYPGAGGYNNNDPRYNNNDPRYNNNDPRYNNNDRGYNNGTSDRNRNPDDNRGYDRPSDRNSDYRRDAGDRGDRSGDRDRNGRQFSMDQAVQACQDAVSQQASQRFGARQLDFQRTRRADDPDARDSVVGTFAFREGDGDRRVFRFSCSVNFDNGQVRSARIDPVDDRR